MPNLTPRKRDRLLSVFRVKPPRAPPSDSATSATEKDDGSVDAGHSHALPTECSSGSAKLVEEQANLQPTDSDEGDTQDVYRDTDASELSKSLWAEASEQLSASDRAALSSDHSINDSASLSQLGILQSVLEVARSRRDEMQQKRWTVAFNGRTIVVRDVIVKVVAWVDKFKKIGDLVSNFDPVHSALPWAAVRMVLQVVTCENEQDTALLLGVEESSRLISRCALYECLYPAHRLDDSIYQEASQYLTKVLRQLYVHILQFLATCCRLYSKSTASRTAHSFFNADQYTSFVHKCVDFSRNIESEIRNCDAVIAQKEEKIAAIRYEKLHGLLDEIQAPLLRVDETVRKIGEKVEKDERNKILQWISSIPYEDRHRRARDDRISKTGSWLLEDTTFRTWRDSSCSSVLWLYGSPGTGKTRLVSAVIDDLQTHFQSHTNDEALIYFYCDRNQPDSSDADLILGSVVRQLATSDGVSIPNPVYDAYTKAYESGFASSHLGFEQKQSLLSELLFEHAQVTIVLDGLDECSRAVRTKLVSALDSIARKTDSLLKIFISSRPDADIKSRFERTPSLELTATVNQKDISRFVEERLASNEYWPKGKFSQALLDEVRDTIIKKSDGMFQWASLQLSELFELFRESDIRESLGRLPQGLNAMYEEMYSRIKSQRGSASIIAERAFQWMMASIEPLTPEFLTEVVCQDSESNKISRVDVSFEDVQAACRNLLILDKQNNACRFSHLSVQEYLEENHFNLEYSNLCVAKICLVHLLEDAPKILEDGSNMPLLLSPHARSAPLLGISLYSKIYWPFHVRMAEATRYDSRLSELTLRFLTGTVKHEKSAYYAWAAQKAWLNDVLYSDCFHLSQITSYDLLSPIENVAIPICSLGLYEMLQDWWSTAVFDVNGKCDRGCSLLWLACEGGHLKVAKELLRRGATLIVEGDDMDTSPLVAAARNGDESVMEFLLDTQMTGLSELDRVNALHAAIMRQNENIARLLLQKGVSPNCESHLSNNALELHSSLTNHQGDGMVRLLLEHGANVRGGHDKGFGALHSTVKDGNEDLALLLLEHGAESRHDAVSREKLLYTASQHGMARVVEVFLNHGADVNHSSWEYGTALQAAAAQGHYDTVVLLLKRGAIVSIRGGPFDNALFAACLHGHDQVFSLLVKKLEEEVHTNALDSLVQTALSWSRADVTEFCLNIGADGTATNVFGRTALHGRLASEQIRVIESHDGLMEVITSCRTDSLGMTVLHHSAYNSPFETCQWIIQQGVPVDCVDNQLWTPLHWAAYFGSCDNIDVLLAARARRDAKTKTGLLPWDLAISRGFKDAASKLAVEASHYTQDITAVLSTEAECDCCDQTLVAREFHHCTTCGHRPGFDLCFRCIEDVASFHPNHEFITGFSYYDQCDLSDNIIAD